MHVRVDITAMQVRNMQTRGVNLCGYGVNLALLVTSSQFFRKKSGTKKKLIAKATLLSSHYNFYHLNMLVTNW